MRIDIWSDVACPWCYIGKRRLEQALDSFPHRDQVEVVWRSFELDPTAPTDGTERVADALAAKYGLTADGVREMQDRVVQVAAEVGLDYSRLADGVHVNTVDAHRLLHAAGERRGDLKEALLHAYLVEARNVADHDVLVDVATSVGLDAEEARSVLASDAHRADVEADVRQARALGASGVPFFVLDGRYGVSGAQPTEVFAQALEQAWAARTPLTPVGGDAPGCDGDTCAT